MKAEISHEVGKEVSGYVFNSGFSKKVQEVVFIIQNKLVERFSDSLWVVPPEILHITLMDWFAPLVEYDRSHEELFQLHKESYIKTLNTILVNQNKIKVHFRSIRVSPVAIYIVGFDDGSYQNIRNEFTCKEKLVDGTKSPPDIIHASIARFTQEIDLSEVEKVLSEMQIDAVEEISEFRLIKEECVPMQKHKVIQTFPLAG